MKKMIQASLVASIALTTIGATTSYAAVQKDTDATVEYTAGELKLNGGELPDNLNFGKHAIQNDVVENWVATVDGIQTSEPTTGTISVSDNRGSLTPDGWVVKVKQVEEWKAGTDELLGAEMTAKIDASSIETIGGVAPTGTSNIDASTGEFKFGPVGDEKEVLKADKANGEGQGTTTMDISSFHLKVPTSAVKKQATYSTTFEWVVSNTP